MTRSHRAAAAALVAAAAVFPIHQSAAAVAPAAAPATEIVDEIRPNIVLIVADDLGYGDIGPFGQTRIRTPCLDRMASEGLRLTRFLAGAPVCAPSRAVMLTGRHSGRQVVDRNRGVGDVPLRPNPEDFTFVEAMRQSGYRTAMAGKWGLGGATRGPDIKGGTDTLEPTQGHALPRAKGFETSLAVLDQATAHEYFPPTLWREETTAALGANFGKPLAERRDYVEDAFTSEALRALARQTGSAADGRPLFLFFPTILPHRKIVAPPGPNPYAAEPWPQPERDYAAMVTRLDTQVGRLLDAIRADPALSTNTLVLFTSDNGPNTTDKHDSRFFRSAGALRGIKRDLYEGGLRAPTLAWWPGHVAAGTVSATVGGCVDMAVTLCDISGTSWTAPTDGVTLRTDWIAGSGPPVVARPPMVWLFFEPGAGPGETPQRAAVRHGRWKLVMKATGAMELYDLEADPGEKSDIARDHPEEVDRLDRILRTQSRQELPATIRPDTPTSATAATTSTAAGRPNVLWIVADDMGPDAGCYGTPLVRTSALDSLAAAGTLFTRAYGASSVCSPSRSSLMTGRQPTAIDGHNHRTDPLTTLSAAMPTVTEAFRAAGYHTANDNGEGKRGKEDYNFTLGGGRRAFDGIDWRGRAPGQPFFAQVNLPEPHRRFRRDGASPTDPGLVKLPPFSPDDPECREDMARYIDTVHLLDRRVGEVLRKLDADGLATSTVVVMTADNGRPHLRDKQFLYDGGAHVPLIVRWPGHVAAGHRDDRLVSLVDLPADSLRAAGIAVPGSFQGVPFLDLTGLPSAPRREAVFASRDRCDEAIDRIRMVRTERYSYLRNLAPDRAYLSPNRYKFGEYPAWRALLALRDGGKLTPAQAPFAADRKPPEELYDLAADPMELRNLAAVPSTAAAPADPAVAAELSAMRRRLSGWLDRDGDDGAVAEPPDTPERMSRFFERRYGPVTLWTPDQAKPF